MNIQSKEDGGNLSTSVRQKIVEKPKVVKPIPIELIKEPIVEEPKKIPSQQEVQNINDQIAKMIELEREKSANIPITEKAREFKKLAEEQKRPQSKTIQMSAKKTSVVKEESEQMKQMKKDLREGKEVETRVFDNSLFKFIKRHHKLTFAASVTYKAGNVVLVDFNNNLEIRYLKRITEDRYYIGTDKNPNEGFVEKKDVYGKNIKSEEI